MKRHRLAILLFSCILVFVSSETMAETCCTCPGGFGSKSGSAAIIKTTGNGTYPPLIVCGSLDFQLDDTTALASEYEIYSYGSDSSLMYFDADQVCKVVTSGSKLHITEYRRGPIGENWRWIDFPVREFVVYADLSHPVEQKTIFKFRQMTADEISEALARYHAAVESGQVASYDTQTEMYSILGSIWTAALNGDSSAFGVLDAMWEPLKFDGEIAEAYMNMRSVYNVYAKALGNLPLLAEEEE